MGDLLPQLSDDLHIAVLVHHGLVHDILDPVGIAESAECLVVVQVGRGYGYNGIGKRFLGAYEVHRRHLLCILRVARCQQVPCGRGLG